MSYSTTCMRLEEAGTSRTIDVQSPLFHLILIPYFDLANLTCILFIKTAPTLHTLPPPPHALDSHDICRPEAPLLNKFGPLSHSVACTRGPVSARSIFSVNHQDPAMSTGQLARQRSGSSGSRSLARDLARAATPIDTRTDDVDLEPCAATGSYFIYTQGSAVVILHHDTLKIDRRFEKHQEKVLLLAVDNVSERGAGRLCVTYDAGLTAIVWDLLTGNEVARFISYEPLKVAAWMKNGNVAFGKTHLPAHGKTSGLTWSPGNNQGSVVIFESSTSEHISARTIFDPITAIAPATDCQTYAIGYKNGSILIANLMPSFTILHTLTTQRAPSPIVSLAWHASSSKQKSDMLASQTSDGDLRVWSVAKPPTAEVPKTIRILKRGDNVEPGINWVAWSKNGRVVQYQDGEVWVWDVRTKHVSCEPVPIIGDIKGLANYGAQATLFTLGHDHTIRQYDLSPPTLVKEKKYLPMEPPPQPKGSARSQGHHIPGTAPPMPVRAPSRQSDNSRAPVNLSAIQRTANEMSTIEQARLDRSEMASPVSTTSRTDTMSSRSSNPAAFPRYAPSVSSRAASGTTFSTISPSMVGRDSMFSGATSMYPSTLSMTSSGHRSRGSRLRNEVLRSPESQYVDLFPRTRARLANMAYEQPQPLDQDNMSPDELRRRMLSIVFGWENDIEPLVRDELHHHQPGSTSAVLLSKWLGEVDSDMMAAAIASGNVSSSDWMVLALSQMGGSNSMGKMGQAFVQRLLQQGDFHTSATILLGLGDREDAVEVYVSRCFFMEAILLTCLIFSEDWQRQAHLVRRWGEFVVENSQQQLAIRCFSCTGAEPPLPWGSPAPRMQDTSSQAPSSISSMLSPPISPPPTAKPGRMTTKNSSLKVITSFETPQNQSQFRLPGLASTDRTPTNPPGITPIAESAISPGATPGGFIGAPSMYSANRTATPGGYLRKRLPSIGETPLDVTVPPFPRPSQLPTPDNSGSDLEKEKERHLNKSQANPENSQSETEEPPLLLSSARYDPGCATAKTPTTALPQNLVGATILPSPAKDAFTAFQEKEKLRARNPSRDRKPDGLHIHMPSQDQIHTTHTITADGTSSAPSQQGGSNLLHSLPSAGLSTGRSDFTYAKSPSISGQSYTSAKSPSISGRSIDQYISSVDEAAHHQRRYRAKKRHESREGRTRGSEHKTRTRHRANDRSEDRGRDGKRHIRPAKRSPSSPVPMTPENFNYATTPGLESETGGMVFGSVESRDGREGLANTKGVSKIRSGSKASDFSQRTIRHRSPGGVHDSQVGSERDYSRSKASSRQPSPLAMLDPSTRGRSKSKNRAGSAVRSPSSPLPFSPQAALYRDDGNENDNDPLRLVQANRQRIRSTHRSSSRKPRERGTSSRRDMSTDRRRRHAGGRSALASENDEPRSAVEPRRASDQILKHIEQRQHGRQRAEDAQRKEQAAKELEARRASLLRNPEAPPILYPDQVSRPSVFSRSQTDLSTTLTSSKPNSTSDRLSTNPANGDYISRSGAASVGPYGIPATPRAMRHPRYDNKGGENIPSVPEVPDNMQTSPELYYAGGPTRDLPRSMSAPIPEQQPPPMPSELPEHPAFHKGLRPGKRMNSLQPLGNIGQHRRKGSGDAALMGMHAPVTAGIDETLHAADP
ncbi:MAG: hypothetical protein Q9217_005226, partial [Psora testacea]